MSAAPLDLATAQNPRKGLGAENPWLSCEKPGIQAQFPCYSLEELARETRKEVLQKASPEERLEGLTVEQRVEGLTVEQRVEGLTADDLLEALPPEVRAALAQRLKEDETSARPE